MKRDPKAFLYEIIEAADAIAMAVAGLIFENYKANHPIRSTRDFPYDDDLSDSSLSSHAPKCGHLLRSFDKPIRAVMIGPELGFR